MLGFGGAPFCLRIGWYLSFMDSDNLLLPEEFMALQPLADRFAISDDVRRSDETDAATADEKRDLVAQVEPHLAAINRYLDEHDDESAHLLGSLAEAACEVALEVGWSKESWEGQT